MQKNNCKYFTLSCKNRLFYFAVSVDCTNFVSSFITNSMKELLLVSIGSFFGGGARYLVSKMVQGMIAVPFPLGTMTVNVIGCLLIGFLSGLPWSGNVLSPTMKLMLTTGFCGGFTTFSTMMNETATLNNTGEHVLLVIYLAGSLALGFIALVIGQQLANLVK